ncbi:MAG: hypothetical protein AAGK37_04700 [Pseudomonadota bacterium]
MAIRAVLIIAALAGLAGCGTFLNPFNWFSQEEEVPGVGTQSADLDPRPLVADVTSIAIEQLPDGAILRAVGVPLQQGHWNGELVEFNDNNPSILTFRFRLAPPLQPTRVSTQASREVVVATYVSSQSLANTQEIQVLGARSSRSIRR